VTESFGVDRKVCECPDESVGGVTQKRKQEMLCADISVGKALRFCGSRLD